MSNSENTHQRFAGKVALVTGATSGIGRDTAVALAREGAAVVATGRRAERGAELIAEIEGFGGRAAFVAGDVSDESHVQEAVKTAVERFGGLHLAFNNAGIEGAMGPVTEQTAEIGRASCRERVQISVVVVSLNKNQTLHHTTYYLLYSYSIF